ncbi:MAG: ligase-associated damage response exonuclease [Ferruginibacter sp.]|nr:ligase-associated damage response exonuclease [Ferruginibacter sp.]
MALIEFTDKGLFCPAGGFYIDPWKPVDRAVITHAHSDHARWGSKHYLCHPDSKPILQLRLGDNDYQTLDWNESLNINGVNLSFHPAGHIIGSAQARLEYKDEVWVFTGDYKTEDDGVSQPFEPVPCNVFITESTFALPIYKWAAQESIFADMKTWIAENHAAGKASVFIAYSLGKAQRILKPLAETGIPIYAHGAVYNVHQAFVDNGWKLPEVRRVTAETTKEELKGCIVIAPSGAEGSPWIKRFSPYAVGICSGWMQVRGNQRRKNADAGFALSDHADWEGLLAAVNATGAQKVFATHGFQSAFSRYLNEQGIEAAEVKTAYGNDEEETVSEEQNQPAP